MEIAIAGGHGQVARLLTRRLAARGDAVRAIIRSPEQSADVRADGAQPVVLDLEEADAAPLAEVIAGCDAVVFAAGAGPGSGAQRKETVDYGAAVKLIQAARDSGIARYVMVSSIGAQDPPDGDDVYSVYLRAKAKADKALMDSGLQWTIVRPGRLTDEPGTGKVSVGEQVTRAEIPREDVAAVLAATLSLPSTAGRSIAVTSGNTPVEEAVADLVG